MAHLTNYIVSQLGGFLSLLCDLLMAAKYLDTGIKLYTQRFEKIITYSYGIFAALISVIVLLRTDKYGFGPTVDPPLNLEIIPPFLIASEHFT